MKRFAILIAYFLINVVCSATTIFGGSSGLPYKHVSHNGTRALLKELNGKEIKERVASLLGLTRPELTGWEVKIIQNTDEDLDISVKVPVLERLRARKVFNLLYDYMEERRKGSTSAQVLKDLKVRRIDEEPENKKERKPQPDGYIPGLDC